MEIKTSQIDRSPDSLIAQEKKLSNDQATKLSSYLLSWGYWFSSRTQGLLIHPYITMREITRERFLRPLVVLPMVLWLISWVVAIVMGRVGLWFALDSASWSVSVGRVLVFLWIWGTFFVSLWQLLLGYLYLRFRRLA